MNLKQATEMIKKGLKFLPSNMSNNLDQVLVGMLSIGLQESLFEHRYQVLNTPGVKGPARGFWQFESGGGVKGVMTHAASKTPLQAACKQLNVPFDRTAIWQALETNDDLAVICARLLLYTDPKSLPLVQDEESMWQYYLRCWRPGAYTNGTESQRKALRAKWTKNHKLAREEVMQ